MIRFKKSEMFLRSDLFQQCLDKLTLTKMEQDLVHFILDKICKIHTALLQANEKTKLINITLKILFMIQLKEPSLANIVSIKLVEIWINMRVKCITKRLILWTLKKRQMCRMQGLKCNSRSSLLKIFCQLSLVIKKCSCILMYLNKQTIVEG